MQVSNRNIYNLFIIFGYVILASGTCHASDAQIMECKDHKIKTKYNSEIQYVSTDSGMTINIKTNEMTKFGSKSYECYTTKENQLWDYTPKYLFESDKYIILKGVLTTSSGTNPAPVDFEAVIFSKDSTTNELYKSNIISSSDIFLVSSELGKEFNIFNIKTGKEIIAAIIPVPYLSKSISTSFKNSKIINHDFTTEYETINANGKSDVMRMMINLKNGKSKNIKLRD